MSNEYVPTTEEIREAWVIVDEPDTRSTPPLWIGAEFDRWLVAHDAEVAAKALEDWSADRREVLEGMDRDDDFPGARDYWEGAFDAEGSLLGSADARAAALRATTNEGNDAL